MQNRKKQNISKLSTFHLLSLQTELENERDHLKTFMDLETLGIM